MMCLLGSGINLWVHLHLKVRLEARGWPGSDGLASKVSASGPLFGHMEQVVVTEVTLGRRGKGNIQALWCISLILVQCSLLGEHLGVDIQT